MIVASNSSDDPPYVAPVEEEKPKETEVYVDINTLTGKLLVVPLPGRVQERLKER